MVVLRDFRTLISSMRQKHEAFMRWSARLLYDQGLLNAPHANDLYLLVEVLKVFHKGSVRAGIDLCALGNAGPFWSNM